MAVDYKLKFVITADARNAEKVIDDLSNKFKPQGSLGKGIAEVFGGNIATKAFSTITAGFTALGEQVFDFSRKISQAEVAFTSLTGSSEAAKSHIQELLNLSKSTPLPFESLAKMSQRLQGAGLEAQKIPPLLRDIGNVAAATGPITEDRLEGIAVALAQIQSKGRLSAEEMEQLAERGVPAWKILSESLGKSQAEIRKLGEQGKLSADEMFQAFMKLGQNRFGDALANQIETFDGAWQQIRNSFLIQSKEFFKPLYEKIEDFATDVATSLQRQESEAKSAGVSFGYAIGEGIGLGMRRWYNTANSESSYGNWILGLILPPVGAYSLAKYLTEDFSKGLAAGLQNPFPDIDKSVEIDGIKYKWDPQTNTFVRVGSPPSAVPTTPMPFGADKTKPAKELPPIGSLTSLVLSSGNPQWDAWLVEMGRKYGVDPNILLLQMRKESSFNPKAVSPKGAEGLMQFMPGTAARFGVDPFNPRSAIEGGARYMAQLLSMFGGDYSLALAGYNAGEGRVLKSLKEGKGIPNIKETRDYVATILGKYQREVLPKAAGKEGPRYGTFDLSEYERQEIDKLAEGLDKELELFRVQAFEKAIADLEKLAEEGKISEMELFDLKTQLMEQAYQKEIEVLQDKQTLYENDIEKLADLQFQQALRSEKFEVEYINRMRERIELEKKLVAELQKQEQEAWDEKMDRMKEYYNTIRRYQKEQREEEERRRKEEAAARRATFGARTFDPMFGAVGGQFDEFGNSIFNLQTALGNLGDMAGSVLMQIGQGLGSMLEAWVMLGDQADISMKKMVASILAGVAAQAATLAVFHFALGLLALTPWGAAQYGPAVLQFTAAAIFAGIAAGTALAGRAIAGNPSSGKSSSGRGASSSSRSGSGTNTENMNPLPISRVSTDAYTSGRRETAVAALASSVEKLADKINSMRPSDVIVAAGREKRGLIGRLAIEDVKTNASLGTDLLRRAGAR